MTDAHSDKSSHRTALAPLFIQACLTLLCTALLLRLWSADLFVPFNYWGDTIFELALAKSIADGGWIWFIERLGAPFGLEIVAFPQNLTFSSFIMKVIALFTSEPGLILNVFWIAAIALTSVLCHAALRSLGVSRHTSLAISVLYALMPHALYRNVAHISLTYIFVPVVAAFSVEVLAYSRYPRDLAHSAPHVPRSLLVAACIAIGFDYIYNAFFACFFLAAAGAVGAAHGRTWLPLKRVLPIVALVSLCAAINLLPSLLSWQQHGPPPGMNYKTPYDAELYGLKIRQVVSPLSSKTLQSAYFPLDLGSENRFSKLGAVGAIGFLIALGLGLAGSRRRGGGLGWSAGVLTLIGTLLATVGGFGAVFNILISPDIRAYNRIIVFLGFFSFFVFALLLDIVRANLHERLTRQGKPAWTAPIFAAILLCITLIGLADQGKAAAPLVDQYEAYKSSATEEREFVQRIERDFPLVESVYQLPETPFPPDSGRERLLPYDHGRPYLWSNRLSWSWPSFSSQRQAWVEAIGTPGDDKFITNLAISGFSGLWLDRFGYSQADLASLENKLLTQLGKPVAVSSSGRYMLFSLVDKRAEWQTTGTEAERRKARSDLLESIGFQSGLGFYAEEVAPTGQTRHRWSQESSVAFVSNPSDRDRTVELRAQIQGNPGGVLTIKSGAHTDKLTLREGLSELVFPIRLEPKSRSRIEFSFEGSRIQAPTDPRSMYFSIINSTVHEVK